MTMEEKLTVIAQNQQRVYDAGIAKGQFLGEYGGGYTDGKQAEYDRFWDAYQINGTRTTCQGAFAGSGWNSETLKPKYSVKPKTAAQMFAYCNMHSDQDVLDLTEVFDKRGLTLDFSNCTDFQQMFYQAKIAKVGTIDCSQAETTNGILNIFNSTYLTEVGCFIPPPLAMAPACFQANLETFIVDGEITKSMNLSRCSKLTAESVDSIIINLADLCDLETQTLTLHATVGAALEDWQKAGMTTLNWTLVY